MAESETDRIISERLERLRTAVGNGELSPIAAISCPAPLVGLASSRLGRDRQLQQTVCHYLARSVLQCRSRGGQLIVAANSAIEPYARRAAELFAVPLIRLAVADAESPPAPNPDTPDPLDRHSLESCCAFRPALGSRPGRDAALIAIADRIDGVYVRSGGTIERCLTARIDRLRDASTRVAVTGATYCAAARLIAHGAVGWYRPCRSRSEAQKRTPVRIRDALRGSWIHDECGWLVHCTRGTAGPWPGETRDQYLDAMLVGQTWGSSRGAFDSLLQILHRRRLVAAAETSDQRFPVVCFSALSVAEVIARRCFRSHLGRWDYEPYGIAIRRGAAAAHDVRPVVYGDATERERLPPNRRYLFHPRGTTHDWTQEKEWRSAGSIDLTDYHPNDVRVFVRTADERERIPVSCPWQVTSLEE